MKYKWQLFILALILLLAGFLRFYKLNSIAPGLYWEEVALGYDAYSIAKTAKDHHGNFLPVIAFKSFGDWKPSLYYYALVPFVATLGLNEWSVRLPAALSGISIIIAIYKLAGLIIKQNQTLNSSQKGIFQLIAAGLAAISPWAILFSRAAWEVNLATCLSTWGLYFTLQFWQKLDAKKTKQFLAWPDFKSLFIAALLFIAASYTYHSSRLIGPLFALMIFSEYLFRRKQFLKKNTLSLFLKRELKSPLIIGLISLLLMSPILLALNSPQLKQRFQETSIFADLGPIETSNQFKKLNDNSLVSRIFYHRYLLFGQQILKNYFDHFRFDFLFISGDANPRHSIQQLGQLYHLELIFLLLGVYYFLKFWRSEKEIPLGYFFLALLPAALTKTTPHALRILPTMPIFMILVSYGLFFSLRELAAFLEKQAHHGKLKLNSKQFLKILSAFMVAAYIAEFAYFWHSYQKLYPQLYSQEWQFGYKEMVANVNKIAKKYPNSKIYISRHQGRPAMYYWFYSQTNPKEVQKAAAYATTDQGEFLNFQNLSFIDEIDQIKLSEKSSIILALSATEAKKLAKKYPNRQIEQIQIISNLADKEIWHIMFLK